jgi:hypothetical protein
MVMSQIRYFTDVVLSRFDVIVFILGGIGIGQLSARILVWISDSGFEVAFWGRYLVPE